MELELKGNVAVITGGASGIGLASAHCFLAEGAAVMLWDVSPETSQIAQQLSAQYACQVHSLQVDVTRSESVAKAAAMTMDLLGRVDHLVHCAAIGSGKFGFPFTNMKPDDWPRVLEMNIMGMVHVAHAIAPKMITAGRGTMVFLASVAGQIGSQTDPPYSASKAVFELTRFALGWCEPRSIDLFGKLGTIRPRNRNGLVTKLGPIEKSKLSCRWALGKLLTISPPW
jgi:2-hydroxycyclohexanecarboxyl-CoA dehydrogenase